MLDQLINDLLLLGLVALAVFLSACNGEHVIGVGPSDPGDGIVVIDDEATIAEIDAARSLSFSSDRADHLQRIALRTNMGPPAQTYLVDTAFDVLSFEDQKVDVLTVLIKSPAFCADAKSCLLGRLDDLKFKSNRKRILAALDRRGPVLMFPTQPELVRKDSV